MTLQGTSGLSCEGFWCPAFFGLGGEEAGSKEIRRRARAAGWTRKRKDGKLVDLCPECSLREG